MIGVIIMEVNVYFHYVEARYKKKKRNRVAIHSFRDSNPVCKMRLFLGYASISSNFSFPFKRYEAITVYVNKLLQNVFHCVCAVYTTLNCIIYKLSCSIQIT